VFQTTKLRFFIEIIVNKVLKLTKITYICKRKDEHLTVKNRKYLYYQLVMSLALSTIIVSLLEVVVLLAVLSR